MLNRQTMYISAFLIIGVPIYVRWYDCVEALAMIMLVLSRTSVTASLCFSCLTASLSTLPTALPTCFPNFVMAASASSVHGPLARLWTSTYFGCWMGQATESYEFCHFIATILDEFDLKVLQITTLSRKFWNFNLEKSLEKALYLRLWHLWHGGQNQFWTKTKVGPKQMLDQNKLGQNKS